MPGVQEILLLIVVVLAILYLPRLRPKEPERVGVEARSYLKLGVGVRLAILASVFWPLLVAIFLKPWQQNAFVFLYIGFGPVAIGWGISWVIIGYRKDRR